MRAPLLLAVVVALLLAGCGVEQVQRQPVSSDDGLHLTGQLDGRSVNVSHGEPEVLLGPCDRDRPQQRELCIVATTIDGQRFGLVVENPDDLAAGATLPVRASCGGGCEDSAVVEVRRETDRIRPTGGEFVVREAGEQRYAASFQLRFHRGTLTGGFDVDPSRLP